MFFIEEKSCLYFFKIKFTITTVFKILYITCIECKCSSFFAAPVVKYLRRRTFGYVSTYRTSLLCRRKLSIDALAPLTCIHPHSFQLLSRTLVPSPFLSPLNLSSSRLFIAFSFAPSPSQPSFPLHFASGNKGAFALDTHVHGIEKSSTGLRLSIRVLYFSSYP